MIDENVKKIIFCL